MKTETDKMCALLYLRGQLLSAMALSMQHHGQPVNFWMPKEHNHIDAIAELNHISSEPTEGREDGPMRYDVWSRTKTWTIKLYEGAETLGFRLERGGRPDADPSLGVWSYDAPFEEAFIVSEITNEDGSKDEIYLAKIIDSDLEGKFETNEERRIANGHMMAAGKVLFKALHKLMGWWGETVPSDDGREMPADILHEAHAALHYADPKRV